MLPGDYDAAGNLTAAGLAKRQLTCWAAHHSGDDFQGPLEPFGRLCYFLEREKHPVEATTSPGLVIGWRIESGLRYRNVLLIGHFDKIRQKGFNPAFIISVPEKEVHFPPETIFPFALAAEVTLRTLTD